jgi:hypothetical protein
MNEDRTRTRLQGRGVSVLDSFEFAGANTAPATVDFQVIWEADGPVRSRGSGDRVPATDPAAFLGKFRRARSTITCSGTEIGFRFKGHGTTRRGYAQFGVERNGSFLSY